MAQSLLAWTWGRVVASASGARSVLLTCFSTPKPLVCGKGGLPSPVHRMSISISLEILIWWPWEENIASEVHSRPAGQEVRFGLCNWPRWHCSRPRTGCPRMLQKANVFSIEQQNNIYQASVFVQLLSCDQAANLGWGFEACFGRQLLCHTCFLWTWAGQLACFKHCLVILVCISVCGLWGFAVGIRALQSLEGSSPTSSQQPHVMP